MNITRELLQTTRATLTKHAGQSPLKMFAGFDGSVDCTAKAVRCRNNYSTAFHSSVADFAVKLMQAHGKSAEVELVDLEERPGGDAPIIADALAALGVSSVCCGATGTDRHSVFSGLHRDCECIGVLPPASRQAIEFNDGTVFLSHLDVFNTFDWKFIRNLPQYEAIREAIVSSQAVALVGWSEVAHASEIWEGVLEDVIKPSGRTDYHFLFDLGDPSHKNTEQLDELLDLIGNFSVFGAVTLGLNEAEAISIYAMLNGLNSQGSYAANPLPGLREVGLSIYQTMNIRYLLVHSPDKSVLFNGRNVVELKRRRAAHLHARTPGGDQLNAGYLFGMMSGLSPISCVVVGLAASGYYLERGERASLPQLIDYLDNWINDFDKKS